jgi:hypothetical protein
MKFVLLLLGSDMVCDKSDYSIRSCRRPQADKSFDRSEEGQSTIPQYHYTLPCDMRIYDSDTNLPLLVAMNMTIHSVEVLIFAPTHTKHVQCDFCPRRNENILKILNLLLSFLLQFKKKYLK